MTEGQATAANFKILGISDDVTGCDCCGKSNLKKTVALDHEGAVVHYGVDCAARALTGSKKDRKIVESKALAVALATRLLAAGHEPRKVAQAVWNRFGYPTSVKGAALRIGGFGEIAL
jgi:hypothetical protein